MLYVATKRIFIPVFCFPSTEKGIVGYLWSYDTSTKKPALRYRIKIFDGGLCDADQVRPVRITCLPRSRSTERKILADVRTGFVSRGLRPIDQRLSCTRDIDTTLAWLFADIDMIDELSV